MKQTRRSATAHGNNAAGSRRQLGKEARRTRILDATAELLRENTHETVTLEQIARHAQVAEMTVFNLVGNRSELWAALAERVLAGMDLGANSSEDAHDQALGVAGQLAHIILNEPAVFRAVLRTWTESTRSMLGRPTRVLRDCFVLAVDQGIVVSDLDVRCAAELLSAALLGAAHEWSADAINDAQFQTRLRDMVDMAFLAYRPAGPPRRLRIVNRPTS
jgi:AcrR family transcriptional regulator